jgi:hypothetical protein
VSCILFNLVISSIVGGIFASHINNWVHLGGFLSGFCIGLFVHLDNFNGRNLLLPDALHHQVEYCEVSDVLVFSDQNIRQGGQDDQNIPSEISVDEKSVEIEVRNHAYMIIEARSHAYKILYGPVLTKASCMQQDASEIVRQPGRQSGIIGPNGSTVKDQEGDLSLAASSIQLKETGPGLAASSIQLGETGAGLAASSIHLTQTGAGLARSLGLVRILERTRSLSSLSLSHMYAHTDIAGLFVQTLSTAPDTADTYPS